MRFALLIQYDGGNYHGWQIQPNTPTVQGSIESALQKVFGEKIALHGSGRTDAGVHALGQVAHFDVDETSIPHTHIWMTLNRYLPADIRILASAQTNADFHSRFMAVQRQYRYQIISNADILRRNACWHVRFPLSMDILESLSRQILGVHDFSSFCYAQSETENMTCNISKARWEKDADGVIRFTVKADRFLHHMVRMLVGSMVEVARGKWEIGKFTKLLENPDRQNHTVTAAPQGLALIKVSYPDEVQPDWLLFEQDLAPSLHAG
ncbi:MAG: tRNA pseudouridine(38-40) synthase TruA [Candidatus Marinimicrobia bacterium]|nr:tRNA pseudouridine(38-40) synthase TruA [Candidatus Neomarinimicrobiota bacterium]